MATRREPPALAPTPRTAADLVKATLAALACPPAAVLETPARPGVTEAWPTWVAPGVREALGGAGVTDLWAHQVRAAEAAWAGRHVVIASGTASGKSLGYWLPALSAAVSERATTLYCTPTKALAHDQWARLTELGLPEVGAACYDGDTDRALRPAIRRTSRFVLTNPDMVHRSVLPQHSQWRTFLSRLRYVVLDEGHMYRGIFGAHVAAVVSRLVRVARAAGADPAFVICSATYGDARQSAARLLGVPPDTVTAVTEDTSSRGARTVILHDPGRGAAESPSPPRAFTETAAALTAWTAAGVRSVGFVRSRAGAEALADTVRRRSGGAAVTAYRGGLLPEERRTIERGLRSGEVPCVAATNALELGVDIAGLDAVALCGWPGTRLSFLQQIGRAGRSGEHAVALLSAQENPLDRFYVNHPERIFGASLESCVLDRDNPHVLLGHVACAIDEGPLTTAEAEAIFGAGAAPVLEALRRNGLIRLRGDRWFWVDRQRPDQLADLRGGLSHTSIVDADTGRVIGTVDGAAAPAQLHSGAVYTHLGETHVVLDLDLADGVAVVRRDQPGYTTVAQSVSQLNVLGTTAQRSLGVGTLQLGTVTVTTQVTGFLKRDARTGQVVGREPLDLPPGDLRTTAVWWQLPDAAIVDLGLARDLPGAAHAAEHAAIGVLPALATCDRWDIGGLSTARHADTGVATVFVYDGYPGGAGFARRGYDAAEEWLAATHQVVATCACGGGCPGCVQSPKCGNGNEPLDKGGAVRMLSGLIG